MCQVHGLRKEKRLADEIDGILTKRNRIVKVVEVKLKPFERSDANRFLEKVEHLPGRHVLVYLDTDQTQYRDARILGARDLIDLIHSHQ